MVRRCPVLQRHGCKHMEQLPAAVRTGLSRAGPAAATGGPAGAACGTAAASRGGGDAAGASSTHSDLHCSANAAHAFEHARRDLLVSQTTVSVLSTAVSMPAYKQV